MVGCVHISMLLLIQIPGLASLTRDGSFQSRWNIAFSGGEIHLVTSSKYAKHEHPVYTEYIWYGVRSTQYCGASGLVRTLLTRRDCEIYSRIARCLIWHWFNNSHKIVYSGGKASQSSRGMIVALALFPYTETSRVWFKNMQLNKRDREREKV